MRRSTYVELWLRSNRGMAVRNMEKLRQEKRMDSKGFEKQLIFLQKQGKKEEPRPECFYLFVQRYTKRGRQTSPSQYFYDARRKSKAPHDLFAGKKPMQANRQSAASCSSYTVRSIHDARDNCYRSAFKGGIGTETVVECPMQSSTVALRGNCSGAIVIASMRVELSILLPLHAS